jgi:hypothetical protein
MKPGLKNPLMRVTNLLLYLSFCGLIGTGALIEWKLVPGSEGGHGLTVLDMSRHEWGDIHFWLGGTCIGATLFHLVLNWPWLKKIASSGKAWRLLGGLGAGLIIIFGIYLLPLEQQTRDEGSPYEEHHQKGGKQHGKSR